jgi:hypothetical protein
MRGFFCQVRLSVVAAATENYNYRKNNYPGAVIVEDVAEAVVVHKVLRGCILWRL